MKNFIFVLDADSSDTDWTFVISADSEREIKSTACYDPGNRSSVSKSVFKGDSRGPATIKDCVSGNTSSGTIVKLTKISKTLKRKTLPVLLFAMVCFYSSCKSGKEITYRYDTKTEDPNYVQMNTLVDVDANVQDVPSAVPSPTPSPINLDPKALSTLIKSLSGKTTPDSLIYYLSVPLKSKSAASPFLTTKLSYSKRLNISVRDLGLSDADRISKLSLTLTEPTNTIRFTGCDKIVTQYQTIDLADLSFKNTSSGEVNAGAGFGSSLSKSKSSARRDSNGDSTTTNNTIGLTPTVNVSGKLGFSNELDGTASLQKRYVSLSGNFKDNTVSFYQESTTGINLTGTIVSDVSFEFDINNSTTYIFYGFDNLFDSHSALVAPAAVKVSRQALTVPNIDPNSVYRLDLAYTAVYRHVTDKDKHIVEGFHNVVLRKGNVNKTANAILIRARDILPKVWTLFDPSNNTTVTVGIAGLNGNIYFDSYESAFNLLRWLIRSGAAVGTPVSADGYRLTINGAALTPAVVGRLIVRG